MFRFFCSAFRSLILSIFLILCLLANLDGKEKRKFYHISVEQGLSQSAVTCMLQDKDGFLWFGTQNGLNKYDGTQFINKKFNFSEFISCLCEDDSGNIWIGTEAGVVHKFDIFKEKFTRQDNIKVGPYRISSIYFDKSSNLLWVGSEGGGLIIFDVNTNESLITDKSKPTIYAINKDNFGNFWLGTERGLSVVLFNKDTKNFASIPYQIIKASGDTLSKYDKVKTIFIYESNKIWLGTMGKGLFELTPIGNYSKLKFNSVQYDSKDSLWSKNITAIFQDNLGIWIATSDNGLYTSSLPKIKFDNEKRNPFDKYSLSRNEVTSILKDRSGVLWFGTIGGGLNKLKQEKFEHYYQIANDEHRLQDEMIWSFYQDNPDFLWIGTDSKGILRFNLKDNQSKSIENYTKNSYGKRIRAIFHYNEDELWLGTDGDGIYSLNKNKSTIIKNGKLPDSLQVRRIIRDKDNTIWIATLNKGLYSYDNEKVNAIIKEQIYTIFNDSKNNIWLGTLGKGLIKLNKNNPKESNFVNIEKGLSSNNVYSIAEAPAGILWIGTSSGINKFDITSNNVIEIYKTKDGLPDNLIYGILVDKNNNLWISTNNELSYFNTKDTVFFNYGIEDGVQGYEFNGGAYFQYDSVMYFGGIGGFNRFNPERVVRAQNAPALFITRLITSKGTVNVDTNITNAKTIDLSSYQRSFSLKFAALDYTAPSSIIYRYMLEKKKYSQEWKPDSSKIRKADYFNVEKGEYTFKVQVSTNGHFDKTDSLKINIEPFWWERSDVQIPFLLFISVILWLLFKTYKGRRKYYEDIAILNEIGKEITITPDLQINLIKIYDLVRKSMDAPTFAIATYDKDKQALYYDLYIEKGNQEKAPPVLLSEKNRFGVYCFERQKEIVMNNVFKNYKDNEFGIPFDIEPIVGKAPQSLIYLPLKVEGKCIGVLTVQSFRKKAYRKNNIIWLENLASYTAIALENARVNRENILQLQELKAANKKLNELDQRKTHFLNIASHAIGSPLSPVGISLQEMQSDISKVTEEELKKAYIRVKQVLNTINNLLNLSKIEDKVIDQNLSFSSVKNVILKTIPIFKIEADIEKIKFDFSLPRKDLLEAEINEFFVEQIVFNLLSNAIKFTKKKFAESGGTVNLKAKRENGNIKVTVSDNGIGIPEDQQDKIFDKFYKIDASSPMGTGLGLSIVKYLVVELHKGQIKVDSKLNFGSTFTFTIPIRKDI